MAITRLLMLGLVVMLHFACTVNQPCTVKLEQSPELRGFRLGMSMSDIQKRFPGFPAVSANQFGLATIEISSVYARSVLDRQVDDNVVSFVSASPFPELNELKHVELKLLDGRLIEIMVYYPNDIKWKSADEFVQKTSEALKLNGTWQKIGDDDDYSEVRHLYCGKGLEDFTVSAGFRKLEETKFPYVEMEDFSHGKLEVYMRKSEIEEKTKREKSELEEKTKREEEERKKTFKP